MVAERRKLRRAKAASGDAARIAGSFDLSCSATLPVGLLVIGPMA